MEPAFSRDPSHAILKQVYEMEEFKVSTDRTERVLSSIRKLLGSAFTDELLNLHRALETKVSLVQFCLCIF